MRIQRFQPTVLAGLIAAIAWPAARAQNAPQVTEFEQVIVTSQKRKENVQQVPLSVSVISGETLQENRVNDVSDLSRAVPNLSYSSQAGAGLSTLEIRGVSSQAGSATVSIYLDEVSLTTRNIYSQGAAEPRFFDLERVEVLRGPQGTLYGASSLGGTIRFVSKQPDPSKFTGSVLGELSTTSHGGTNHVLQGVLNVPLVQGSTALRVGVQTGRDSGWIDRVDPNTLGVIEKGINSTQWDVLKLALRTDLGRGWSVTPALFAQRYKSADIDAAYLNVGAFQLPQGSTADPPALALFQTSKPVREPATDKLRIPSLTVNGDVGIGDFTGILSGYQRRFDRIQDGTSINVPYIASQVADPALSNTVYALPSAVQLSNKIDQVSLELRVASKDYDAKRSPFTWIAGVYLAQTKTQVFDNEPIFGINAAFTAAGRDINNPNDMGGSFPGAFTGDSSYYSARHYRDKQSSVFGELTYHASPSLRAIAGVRVLSATQHFTREGDFYYAGGPSTAVIDSSAHAVTPRFAVDWDLSKETTVYANIAKGFRLGAANRPIPSPDVNPLVGQDLANLRLPNAIPAAFKPDSLWSYEVGSKSRLFDNRVALNLAAFYIDWKNIQQNVVLPQSGFDFETNVGKARSYGIEAEGRVRATDDLTLNASAGLTRATFAEDVVALGADSNGVLNARKGDWVQGVPRYNARLGFEYRFYPMTDAQAFVRASGQWTGPSHGTFVREQKDHLRPAYFTADASAGMSWKKWEVSLFVKNLTNNHRIIQQPSIQSVNQALYLRPRTIGVTVSYER
ncbi:TonB-dependent receptor [Ramlibacter sp. PS4R-6]|uniref:TonB-dependent receptor n=1 Tax=Ramlibacter sp. PS4R-6 TaxID=3133438 RepID=UPI0030AFBAD6